jgi:hypothetical protein
MEMSYTKSEISAMFEKITNSEQFSLLALEIALLNKRFDNSAVRQEYSRCASVLYGYYQKIPYIKIWTSNYDLGRLLIRTPKSLNEVFVHDFDEFNRLIRTTYHYFRGEKQFRYTEFFFYSDGYEWTITYFDHWTVCDFNRLTLSIRDENGLLLTHYYFNLPENKMLDYIKQSSNEREDRIFFFEKFNLGYNDNRVERITHTHFFPFRDPVVKNLKVEYDNEGFVVGGTFFNLDNTISSCIQLKKRFKPWY